MNKFKCSMQKKKESLADNVNLGFKVGDFKGTQKSVILKIKKALDNKGIANEVVADGRCLEVTLDNANVIIQTVAEGGYGSHKSSSYVVLGKDSDNYRNQTDAYSIKDVMDYIQDANGRKSEATYNPDESKKSEANIDDLKGMVVSEGTMGVNVLIRKYLDVLETYAPDNYKAYIEANPELKDRNVWMALDVQDKSYIVDELADELDKIAPEGYYFGASEGDGACYGFWEVDPNESKKPEACKGGKDDDKKGGKDGKAAESKKSEGVGDTIKMGIDYTMFMRMLDTAAYLDADDDYKEALWDYFSEMGEIEDALVFFDNLFQYTDWKTAEEIWDDYSNILGEKPEGQDAEEALDAYLEENDLGGESAYKHGDHYLIVR